MARKDENRNRQRTLMIMLDDAEKEIIRAKAEAAGMTMSSYARFVLLGSKGESNDGA